MSPPVGTDANYRDNYFTFGFATSLNDRMEYLLALLEINISFRCERAIESVLEVIW